MIAQKDVSRVEELIRVEHSISVVKIVDTIDGIVTTTVLNQMARADKLRGELRMPARWNHMYANLLKCKIQEQNNEVS